MLQQLPEQGGDRQVQDLVEGLVGEGGGWLGGEHVCGLVVQVIQHVLHQQVLGQTEQLLRRTEVGGQLNHVFISCLM